MIAAPTVAFVPCCEPGESIIFMDTVPLLSTNLVDGAIYRYTGSPATGQGQGPLGIDTLVSGQCYTLLFGVSASIYPTLPISIVYTSFFGTGNSCLNQTCVDACGVSPVEPTSNRYLQYVPCCVDSGPTLYFRVPGINVPIDGVASYVGTINSNPYPTTDVNCNPTTSLASNKCYSITLHTVGAGQPVSNVTQYNCLAVAPQNISGNYIYHSPVYPAQPDSSCQKYISACPECNPLCFTLWSCDGSQPLFTTSTDLTAFVGLHITVSSVDPENNIVDLCVFVQDTTEFNCINAIEVTVTSNSCICDCTCYTVTGNLKSIEYIDCSGNYVLLPDLGLSTSSFCAQSYPIVFTGDDNIPIIITNNGDCVETTIIDAETCEEVTEYICTPAACYLLEDCTDSSNVIYSNSPSLALPANLGQVVTIVGHTECWKILIPQECICPINVTVLTTSACCLSCLPNINYKLTSCNDSTIFTYTSDDLSSYVDRVIRKEDCPEECWIVTEIDGNIPSDTTVTILDDYLDCEKCYRKYYRLHDCLGLKSDIITYTDLSDYVDKYQVGKIITLDWCPETCWEITETLIDDGAGVISDILNSYTECIECLTNAPCICSTIKNYNTVSQTYKYLDCEGILQQTVTLLPGQKSDRLCLIRWYAPEPCDELIVNITSSTGVDENITVYQNSINHPGPVLVNDKPTWKDIGNNLYIYYDGTKWILSKNLTPSVLPSVYTTIGFINCNGDCDCPTGTWQQSSSIPNQDVYVTTEFKYTIEYFGNCTNGVCPPIKNKQKSITPGYNTPGCEAWKYEEISCRAAEAMYKQVLQLRYGISNCCPEEDEQYIVQKELIDLAALYDSTYPCATNSCGCNNDCECSTAEPVCAPLPLTYNCFCTHVGCECIERGDDSGEYTTLALCQAACVPIPPVSYNCVANVCVNPGDGTGEYSTLDECQLYCELTYISYNCINGDCIDPGNGSGVYKTLAECEAICTEIPQVSYNCFRGACSDPGDGSGAYPTYADCIERCTEIPQASFDCLFGTCTDPGDGSGFYPTELACQEACVPTTSWNCVNCECVSVPGLDGTYPTEVDCLRSCTPFITAWITTSPGQTIVLPYDILRGTYSGTINWGDGNTDVNDGSVTTHTYASAQKYFISICGDVIGWNFNSVPNSRNLINSVVQWGNLQLIDGSGYFAGCTNLDLSSVIGSLNLTGITSLSSMFSGCSSISTINGINSWITGAITNMSSMFNSCVSFNQALSFNTVSVTNMSSMFNNCYLLNSPLAFNTVAVQNMSSMFNGSNNFNQPLIFNTVAVTNMSSMFQGCLAFQQNIGSWNISNVANFTNFMTGKTPATWPTTYFDNLLCGWSTQTVIPNLTIDFGSANYTNVTGGPCYTILNTAPKNWIINSGGGV